MKLHSSLKSRIILTASTLACLAALQSAFAQEYRPSLLVPPPYGHSYGFHKAGKFYLKLLLNLRAGFDDPQGIAAVKLASTDDPSTKSDDDELTVYATNSNRHQIIYNRGLDGLASFGTLGSGDGQFHNPQGIAASEDGFVYVADMNNNRIVCLYNEKGKMEFVRNQGAGELSHPMGCAVDASGNLYVADTDQNRIVVFDKVGRQSKAFDCGGKLDRPAAIAMVDFSDKWNYRHETVVVVADSASGRIRKLDQFGRIQAEITGDDIALPRAYFSSLAIDFYGSIYATDMVNHQIHKFDHDLKYVASFGRQGNDDNEFESPRAIAIWKRYGQVFVLERESVQYFWVGIDGYIEGLYPKKLSKEFPGPTISLMLYEPGDFKIVVTDSAGKVVKNLVNEFRETLGINNIVWDGTDERGNLIPPGEYVINVTIEPTYSAKGYFNKKLEARITKE
jgi:DNA-binding beta-propeller fold protein YncE